MKIVLVVKCKSVSMLVGNNVLYKQNYFYLSKLLSYGNPKFHFFYKSLKLTNILNIRVPRKIVPS